jgi:hypothetical protein
MESTEQIVEQQQASVGEEAIPEAQPAEVEALKEADSAPLESVAQMQDQ